MTLLGEGKNLTSVFFISKDSNTYLFFSKLSIFALLFFGTEPKKRNGVIFWTTQAENLEVAYGRLIDSIDFVCVNILYNVQRIYFLANK